MCVSRSVVSDFLQPHGLLCPWESQGKNTAVGYHFLLQCYSYVQYYYWGKLGEGYTRALQHFFSSNDSCCLVAKLCLPLCDPTDCSPPVSSAHGIS